MLSTKGNKRKKTCKIQTRIQHLIAQKKQLRGCDSIRGGCYYVEGNNSVYMNPLLSTTWGDIMKKTLAVVEYIWVRVIISVLLGTNAKVLAMQ